MKGFSALLSGAVIGALSVLLYQRLQEKVRKEDPESLSETISNQLTKLENATRALADK